MKLVSYALSREMEPRLGFVVGSKVVDVLRSALWLKDHRGRVDFFHLPSTMAAALKDWSVTLPLLQDLAEAVASLELSGLHARNRPVALPLSEVVLFPPVPAPPSIRLFPAQASRETELYPGEILACTGLPEASLAHSTAQTTPQWLQPGETLELEIQGLGKLTTPIIKA